MPCHAARVCSYNHAFAEAKKRLRSEEARKSAETRKANKGKKKKAAEAGEQPPPEPVSETPAPQPPSPRQRNILDVLGMTPEPEAQPLSSHSMPHRHTLFSTGATS